MPRNRTLLAAKLSLVLAAVPFVIHAYEFGPNPRYTGAPGDNRTSCIAAGCHTGTVNSGTGNVKIILPNGTTTYTPGQPMAIAVQITDATKVKFGFEMTARLASDLANGQAGDFTPGADGFTQVICDDGSPKPNGSPCRQFPVQFIEHTLNGYEASTRGGYTFNFTWTPPASAVAGNVTLYVAANCGPGDPPVATPTNVYTSSVTLTPAAAAPPPPTINPGGVVPIFTSSTTISPGSWISVYGANLAAGNAVWDGNFPTSLGGVSVTVNNKPAYIWFVSPGQINVEVPDDTATGSVNVVVTNANGSATSTATLGPVSPTFSLFDGTHPAGVILTADGSGFYDANGGPAAKGKGVYDLLGPSGLFAFNTRPVKKGEIVELFGTGFGPTNPPVPAGKPFNGAAPTTLPITVTIGGVSQTLTAFSVNAGVYQLNVPIPANVASGDQTLQASVNGVSSPSTVRISVQ